MGLAGNRLRSTLLVAGCVLAGVAAGPSVASARTGTAALDWSDCGDGFQCATATVPRDYAHPHGAQLKLPVTRLPAADPSRRLGTLMVNFGGPGDPTAETLRGGAVSIFQSLNQRYDILGFDPRGTGGTDAIDCKNNPETTGPSAQPFPRPDTVVGSRLVANYETYIHRCLALNPRILPYVSTANVARDMDRIRRSLGEDRIAYFGFSYGTFLGATYESLFPAHVGRFVLDGALDAEQYLNDPIQGVREQTKAFEVALGRFFQACAAHQDVCGGFGGDDPWAAFDALVDQLNASPLPAAGSDPRPVDGDDLLAGSIIVLYAKQNWPILAQALAQAAAGDGTLIRLLADAFYGRNDDGTYDPGNDRFFAIASLEARFPRMSVGAYLRLGADDYQLFDHYWWNSGYYDLAQELWPVKPKGVYYGPFSAPRSAPTTLVVGTTYDPATPYKGAQRLVRELGNARLLTMRGDGHTAYFGNSSCIDAAVDAYLDDGTLPAVGTVCRQEVPFVQPQPSAASSARATARRLARLQLHVRPLLPAAGR